MILQDCSNIHNIEIKITRGYTKAQMGKECLKTVQTYTTHHHHHHHRVHTNHCNGISLTFAT